MEEVDPDALHFPKHVDAFYDLVGFTVESLVDGRNCLAMAHADPYFFKDLQNLRVVAHGTLKGLELLDKAGVVHNDVKPDNLMWSEASSPTVKLVDFGCARLDQREEGA